MTSELANALLQVTKAEALVRGAQIRLGEALTRQREGSVWHFVPEAQERLREACDERFEALVVVDEIMERLAEERRAA